MTKLTKEKRRQKWINIWIKGGRTKRNITRKKKGRRQNGMNERLKEHGIKNKKEKRKMNNNFKEKDRQAEMKEAARLKERKDGE